MERRRRDSQTTETITSKPATTAGTSHTAFDDDPAPGAGLTETAAVDVAAALVATVEGLGETAVGLAAGARLTNGAAFASRCDPVTVVLGDQGLQGRDLGIDGS